jgi:hypothetical protein
MRRRFRQEKQKQEKQKVEGGAAGPGPTLVPATGARGVNLVVEIAQWVVTTVTLGQAVWRWLRRAKSGASRPPALPDQGKAP